MEASFIEREQFYSTSVRDEYVRNFLTGELVVGAPKPLPAAAAAGIAAAGHCPLIPARWRQRGPLPAPPAAGCSSRR